jgi:PRC-barrel domain
VQEQSRSRLCFLSASKVESPAGELSGMTLRTADDLELGSLDGVLIDPVERRLRFYVIESPGWFRSRRYLLPADCLAQLEREQMTLRVHLQKSQVTGCEEFESGAVREFSDDDLMDALFGRHDA